MQANKFIRGRVLPSTIAIQFYEDYIELTRAVDNKTSCFVAKRWKLTLKMHNFSNSENIKLKNCSPECRFLIF